VPDACEPWPVIWPCDTADSPPELVIEARNLAELMLWGLSGRRLGICEYVEGYYPPCTAECGAPYKGADGEWRNRVSAASNCCRIPLRHAPVVSIEAVTEWGVLLDPTTYDVSARRYLRRRSACWPCEDQCDDPPVEVIYRAGWGYPAGTAVVVGEVACELLAGLAGHPCKLPSRAVQIARQGVTVTLADPEVYLDNGLLGLPLADAWIKAVNPNRLLTASRVYSPDLPRRATEAGAEGPVPSQSDTVEFSWHEADPVNKEVLALDGVAHGWLGTYQAQLRTGPDSASPLVGAFTVTAVADGPDVRLRFVLTAVESAGIRHGTYYWDAQQVSGPTRLTGTARVLTEVTVLS